MQLTESHKSLNYYPFILSRSEKFKHLIWICCSCSTKTVVSKQGLLFKTLSTQSPLQALEICIIVIVFCPSAGLSLQIQAPRLQFYYGWIGALASRCFPHPILSLASEQILKYLKRSQGLNVEMSVDLAYCATRTLPKFTTGIKYQFHYGFWPDQRSGNPNQPSPPPPTHTHIYRVLKITFTTFQGWQRR